MDRGVIDCRAPGGIWSETGRGAVKLRLWHGGMGVVWVGVCLLFWVRWCVLTRFPIWEVGLVFVWVGWELSLGLLVDAEVVLLSSGPVCGYGIEG